MRSASLAGGTVVLDVVEAGPGDAACCPTQKARRRFALSSAGLTEDAREVTGTLSLADLAGGEWVLRSFGPGDPAPAEPEITLAYAEGRFVGSSGCNRYFTGVEESPDSPGSLKVGPVAGTRMACPEEILDLEGRYQAALESVERYRFVAGRLALDYQALDSPGSLLFAPQAEPVAQAPGP